MQNSRNAAEFHPRYKALTAVRESNEYVVKTLEPLADPKTLRLHKTLFWRSLFLYGVSLNAAFLEGAYRSDGVRNRRFAAEGVSPGPAPRKPGSLSSLRQRSNLTALLPGRT